MGMKSELRRRLSKTEGRLRREGRRLASVFLCGALIVGNLSAVPVSVLADDDNDYTYEIEKTALQSALQTAVSEGNTVTEDLEFAGEHAEEYAQLLEADGTLYELELSNEDIEEDDDRDKTLDLRVFARIDGDIPVDEAYEIDGSEGIVFLVSNKTENTVTATISVDGLETDAITILPVDSIPVEKESTAVESTALTTTISSGVSAGGSGGGSGSSSASASMENAETESAKEETVIEITSAADNKEEESASITEDSKVTVVSGEDDSNIAEDETDTNTEDPAEEEDASEDQEITEDVSGNTETENINTEDTGAEDTETGDTDGDVNNAGTEEAGTSDSGAVSENTGDTENDDEDENTSSTETSDNTSTEGGEKNSTSDTDTASGSGNTADDVSDNSGDTGDTSGSGSSSSGISEDSEVSVLGSAISIHNSVLLAASIATDSDADETASASDADNAVDGTVYESVRFDKKGVAAFVTTAADLKLDEIEETESEESVEYTAEADGVSVTVTAPEGALPEGAELSVTVYEEDSYEYAVAAEAIDYTSEDTATVVSDEGTDETVSEESTDDTTSASTGLAVLDISFTVDGEEVEPTESVTVSIDASGIVPEEADASTIEVQHLTESGNEVEATLVADAADQSDGTVDTKSVVAEFEVESFSSFTITWTYRQGGNNNLSASIDVTTYFNGTESDSGISDMTCNSGVSVDLTSENSDLAIDGYTLVEANVIYNGTTYGDVESVTVSITSSGGGYGQQPTTTYTYTTSGGTTNLNASSNSKPTVTVELYYIKDAEIAISSEGSDSEGYTLTATTEGYYTYSDISWDIDDDSVAEIIKNTDGTVSINWNENAETGDSVTVTVTGTYTDYKGETQTVTDSYTLVYGEVAVTIHTTYGGNESTAAGASVALLDSDGNVVASGTTDSNGNITFNVVAGTYTIEATYYVSSSGSGPQSSTTGYSYSGSLEVDATTAEDINLTQDDYTAYDHVDIRVDGTYSLSVETDSGAIEVTLDTYAYSGSEFSVTLPDGTVLSGSAEYSSSNNEVEYRITGQTISSSWDNEDDCKKFSINASILISLSDLREAGLSDSEIESIFGVSLADGSSDLVTYTEETNGVPAGTYIIVQVTDYHPTKNVCEGTAGRDRGYDFEINLSSALTYLTDQLMVYKYVVDEDGKIISDDTSFTFTLTKSDDSSVNKTTSLVSGGSNVFSDIEAGYYYITETASEGYVPVTLNSDGTLSETGYVQYIQSETKTSGSIPSVTFYNLKLENLGVVDLQKSVNEDSANGNYSSDKFTFYLYTYDEATNTYSAVEFEDNSAIEVDADSNKEFYLAAGDYTIIELASELTSGDSQTVTISDGTTTTTLTRTVAGEDNPYGLDENTVYYVGTITVTASSTLTYTATNTYTSGVELPETGGSGTTPFRIAGLLLTSCSAYLLYETLKRRRNYLR